MRKMIFAFIGMVFISAAMAADVAERTDCADTKSRIDALVAQGDLNDSDAALLADLRSVYRKSCSARAAGRAARTIASTRAPVPVAATATDAATNTVDESLVADGCDNPDANGCCPGEEFADMGSNGKFCCKGDVCFPPMDIATPTEPQKTPEEIAAEQAAQIAANVDQGLCEDGAKPNKYGCCGTELFKDMGNAKFACCQKGGTDCFWPIDGTNVTKRAAFNPDDK